jgi:FKBP-type peptidyl-prolyl cis-trans isomerase FkpA
MKYSLFALIITLFVSCISQEIDDKPIVPVDYTEKNEAEILKYLADNKLTAQKTATGLYYIITEPGTGKQPTAASSVKVAYKGYYTTKKGFDQSPDAGTTFGLQQVIQGWTEGIRLFKEGGSGVLIVPARLGYGSFDYRDIPGGSVLVFDIKLIAVN